MGKIIAVINQKGGVGKTTTAVNLAAALGYLGKKTLLVDCDPQGNATSGLGIENAEVSVYECLSDKKAVHKAVINTKFKNLSHISSSRDLSGAEIELAYEQNREYRLRDALYEVSDEFDFIIIDAPPALGMLTINIMSCANSVLIPIQCEYYALEGVSQLMTSLRSIKKGMNKSLEIEGILPTMYDGRTNLSIQVLDEVKKYFGDKVYKSIIPRNVRLSEAPSFGEPVMYYDITSKGSEAYFALAREVIADNK